MAPISRSLLERVAAIRQQAPYVPRAFRLVWDPCRGLTVAWLVLTAIQGLLPAASVLLTKFVVDAAVQVLRSGGAWNDLRAFLIPGGLLGAVVLVDDLLIAISRYVRSAQAQAASEYIERLVQEKAVSIDLAVYDSPDYYDRLHRARAGAASTPLELLASMGRLLRDAITLVATCGVLATYAWWLPVLVAVSMLPALYVALQFIFDEHDLTLRQTTGNRLCRYYDDLVTSPASAGEVRLFGIGNHYISLFQTLRAALRHERLSLVWRSVMMELVSNAFAVALLLLSMAFFGLRALDGRYTIGDLALLYQAYWKGQELLATLHGSIGAIYRNLLYLNTLFEYLDLQPTLIQRGNRAAPPRAVTKGIAFRDVTFRYPGSSRAVVQRFNLDIGAGDTVAIVGENGAGKSTLAKLLCRFYDPQEGSISIDGIDIREFPLESLRAMSSVLFQSPVHYREPVAANVAVSTAHTNTDPEAIRRALVSAGADQIVRRLPEGTATVLGKMFPGGVELSGGEWQRIALARSYLREAPILILDEPTSAMDPWSEAEWLRQLEELERSRTTIIISHRFSIALHATRIHVMHDGEIIESGTHAELMARDGKYAAGWHPLLIESP